MFSDTKSFNQDLLKWDVSRVTNMVYTFNNVASFNQDLPKWGMSRVTDMTYLFCAATSFNRDMSKWDGSKVTGTTSMFRWATSFNQDLCGAVWVQAWSDFQVKEDKMFEDSHGLCTRELRRKLVLR